MLIPPCLFSVSAGVVRGINVTKEGSDPKALPDSEYPPWLFQMADKAPMRNADALNPADGRIYFKKSNLTKIRRNNFVRDKKR